MSFSIHTFNISLLFCQYSFLNVVTVGEAKFQVDVKEEGGSEFRPKSPVGKSEMLMAP